MPTTCRELLVDWKEIFGKHVLRVKSREDGGAFGWAVEKDLGIRLDGKKLNQRDIFVYLGG